MDNQFLGRPSLETLVNNVDPHVALAFIIEPALSLHEQSFSPIFPFLLSIKEKLLDAAKPRQALNEGRRPSIFGAIEKALSSSNFEIAMLEAKNSIESMQKLDPTVATDFFVSTYIPHVKTTFYDKKEYFKAFQHLRIIHSLVSGGSDSQANKLSLWGLLSCALLTNNFSYAINSIIPALCEAIEKCGSTSAANVSNQREVLLSYFVVAWSLSLRTSDAQSEKGDPPLSSVTSQLISSFISRPMCHQLASYLLSLELLNNKSRRFIQKRFTRLVASYGSQSHVEQFPILSMCTTLFETFNFDAIPSLLNASQDFLSRDPLLCRLSADIVSALRTLALESYVRIYRKAPVSLISALLFKGSSEPQYVQAWIAEKLRGFKDLSECSSLISLPPPAVTMIIDKSRALQHSQRIQALSSALAKLDT